MRDVAQRMGVFIEHNSALTFTYDLQKLRENQYKVAGQMVRWSLANGGPGLPSLAPGLFDAMTGRKVELNEIDNVPDTMARTNMLKVWILVYLAPFDSVSRGHSMGLLSVVCRPSPVRLCVLTISEPNARISFKFWLLLPLGHTALSFFEFLKIVFDFLRTFFVFVNMGPYGRENCKTLLLLQIAAEIFQTVPEFFSQWSSQKYCFRFLKC